MSADNGSSNHSNADDVSGVANASTAASAILDSTNSSPQPRAKINISLGGKKKKKSTTNNRSTNNSNLISSKDGKSSLLAEEYSTIAEEAEIISQKRKEEGTILVIPCAQGANEEEKRKQPLLAGRLALLQKGTADDTAAAADNADDNDGNAKNIKEYATNTNGDEQRKYSHKPEDDLENEVVKQLIQAANQTQQDKEHDGDNTTSSGRGLIIAAPSKNNLITQQTTVLNEDEQFHQELAHHATDVDPTSSVYANVAIGDFGSALLRGMGWKGGDNNDKGNKKEETIKARPHRLGLGAAPLPLPSTTSGSSKGGIHRRARRPDEVKRDEERQKQQEEAERRAAEKKRLDVQCTLQPGSVVYVRDDYDNTSKRARVVKTAGVPGLNRILIQMEDSTEDTSVAKNNVKLCSWDELERMPFQATRSSKSTDSERAIKSIDTEPHQNGSSSRRKRSRSYDSEDERRSRKETSRHSKPYYLQKGVVQDVTRTSQSSPKAVLLMDNGQVIDKVPERYLETALPRTGGKVIVLEGKHYWKKGRLLERSRDGYGVIQFTEDLEVCSVAGLFLATSLDAKCMYAWILDGCRKKDPVPATRGESCTNFGQKVKFHKNSGANGYTYEYRIVHTPISQNNKSFSIKNVVQYLESTGAISGRITWFECYAGLSDFYRLVAKPLTSMGTVGSMDCERRAKPLKNTILVKGRNRMKDPTGVALLRGIENLCHIMHAKKMLGKKLADRLRYRKRVER
eukprot:scaffold3563_cov139-Skeletonema_menzelii.AAC.7